MKLTLYDKKRLGGRVYKMTANYEILKQFVDSEMPCAKLEDYPHCSADSCVAALRTSAKRFGFDSVLVVMRKGEVYLINDLLT